MRTYVREGSWYLTCKEQTGNVHAITAKFDIETVFDWYPLCVSYEVRYDVREELFFISPRDYDHPRKYGITQRRREKATEIASFDIENFYMEEVKKDNEKVISLAKAIGLPMMGDKPGLRAIKKGHERITELYDDPITERMITRSYENMSEKEWKKFIIGDEEAKSIIIHTYATKKEKNLLRESGHLRTYLNLLRKGAARDGF